MTVRVLRPEEHPVWEAFLPTSPDGSIYSAPAYLEALCGATGGRYEVVAVFKGDDIVGGVGVYRERGAGAGSVVMPRLLLYYNGVVARRTESKYESSRASDMIGITAALADHFSASGDVRVSLRAPGTFTDARAFLASGWKARPTYSYVVPLGPEEAMWDRVDQNLRRLVRRAEGEGVTFTVDDDFEAFYALHADTMARKGQPTYLPRARFEAYVRTLTGAGLATLMHARLADGRAAASILVLLGDCRVAHTVCAGGDEEHLRSGVNPLLRWRSLCWLAERGYEGNDLTDAALNPVTRFKSQLGGELSVSLMLDGPRTMGYRVVEGARSAYWAARGAVGTVLRSVLGRSGG